MAWQCPLGIIKQLAYIVFVHSVRGGARSQNLGHLNKVVYCSLFIQTTSYYTPDI